MEKGSMDENMLMRRKLPAISNFAFARNSITFHVKELGIKRSLFARSIILINPINLIHIPFQIVIQR